MFAVLSYCNQSQDQVDKILEGEVEIGINHLEPYKLKGESSTFVMEKEFGIDTERDDIAKTGLTDISSFDIDSEGNIYLLNYRSIENFVYKFNKNGKFVVSFGRKGQGPGEIQRSMHLEVNSKDQIIVIDSAKRKLILFNIEGELINEIPTESYLMRAHSLLNENFLIWHQDVTSPPGDYLVQTPLSLYNPEFKKIKELDRYRLHKNRMGEGTEPLFSWSVSKDYIFIGNEDRDYEIWMFDLDGDLVKKIRKDFQRMKIPDKYKQDKIRRLPERKRQTANFPDYFPPFQGLFTDETGRLFIMTYEQDGDSGEYIFDIFNKEGIFIGRKNLPIMYENGIVMAKSKKQRLYCISEKYSGYKELMVYKMKWE